MKCGRQYLKTEFKVLGWPSIKPSTEGYIFWHIVNFTDKMEKWPVIKAFLDVFDVWQNAMDEVEPKGNVINFFPTSNYQHAHIKLLFVHPYQSNQTIDCNDGITRNFKIPSQLDGSGGTLAYVYYNDSHVYFDEGEDWSQMGLSGDYDISLFDVAAHEMGHALDLGHSEVEEAVMYPYYDGSHKPLHSDDQQGLNAAWKRVKCAIADGSYTV